MTPVDETQVQKLAQATVAIPEYLRQVSVMLRAIDAGEDEPIFTDIPDNLLKIAEFTEGLMNTMSTAIHNHNAEASEQSSE